MSISVPIAANSDLVTADKLRLADHPSFLVPRFWIISQARWDIQWRFVKLPSACKHCPADFGFTCTLDSIPLMSRNATPECLMGEQCPSTRKNFKLLPKVVAGVGALATLLPLISCPTTKESQVRKTIFKGFSAYVFESLIICSMFAFCGAFGGLKLKHRRPKLASLCAAFAAASAGLTIIFFILNTIIWAAY